MCVRVGKQERKSVDSDTTPRQRSRCDISVVEKRRKTHNGRPAEQVRGGEAEKGYPIMRGAASSTRVSGD